MDSVKIDLLFSICIHFLLWLAHVYVLQIGLYIGQYYHFYAKQMMKCLHYLLYWIFNYFFDKLKGVVCTFSQYGLKLSEND